MMASSLIPEEIRKPMHAAEKFQHNLLIGDEITLNSNIDGDTYAHLVPSVFRKKEN
jgi:hypothetical protein